MTSFQLLAYIEFGLNKTSNTIIRIDVDSLTLIMSCFPRI